MSPNVPESGKEGDGPSLEAWGRFLAATSREELMEAAKNGGPVLQKAFEEVERLNRDPATRQLAYERETGLTSHQSGSEAPHQTDWDRGRAHGRLEGLVEGRIESGVEHGAQALLDVLQVRSLVFTDDQWELILHCDDPWVLRKWLRRAVTAASTDEVFAD
jgi:hypothetical protein